MKQRAIDKAIKERKIKIEKARAQAQAVADKAFSIEEIAQAHARYTQCAFDAALKGRENDAKTAAALDAYRKALSKYGFCESDFEYTPLCPVCNDTGNDNGRLCACIRDEYIAILKKECEIDSKARFSFSDCDLNSISDPEQKKRLSSLYKLMSAYVAKYPNVKTHTLTLFGSVGTGKTCLASAMARGFVEKGNSAKILSAYEFNSTMLDAHTSPIAERAHKLHDVFSADILIIDDLGTEPILRNVTIEYLLLTLEERSNRKLSTIITTNLDADGLLNRYGERIYSRLCDKKHSVLFELSGNDLRTH